MICWSDPPLSDPPFEGTARKQKTSGWSSRPAERVTAGRGAARRVVRRAARRGASPARRGGFAGQGPRARRERGLLLCLVVVCLFVLDASLFILYYCCCLFVCLAGRERAPACLRLAPRRAGSRALVPLSRCALNLSWAIMGRHGLFLTTTYDIWLLEMDTRWSLPGRQGLLTLERVPPLPRAAREYIRLTYSSKNSLLLLKGLSAVQWLGVMPRLVSKSLSSRVVRNLSRRSHATKRLVLYKRTVLQQGGSGRYSLPR